MKEPPAPHRSPLRDLLLRCLYAQTPEEYDQFKDWSLEQFRANGGKAVLGLEFPYQVLMFSRAKLQEATEEITKAMLGSPLDWDQLRFQWKEVTTPSGVVRMRHGGLDLPDLGSVDSWDQEQERRVLLTLAAARYGDVLPHTPMLLAFCSPRVYVNFDPASPVE